MKSASARLYAASAAAALLLTLAAPAEAQYKPRPVEDPATGETFHIEGGASFWNPSSNLVVESAGSGALSGIGGTAIDAKRDLGFVDKHFPEFDLIVRPAPAHKFRLQYVPISFQASSIVTRDIVFNGQRYRIGIPVESTLNWKALRFGYEYDFVRKNRGFAGVIVEGKYTDVQVQLASPSFGITEYAEARAPIPALGGIGRVYVVPNISITGEFTAFKLPDSIDSNYAAHYYDLDIYGTVNLTNNIGFKGGYRSLDLGYVVKQDNGAFEMKGIYFGVVARY
jgi:hypothetical protein